MNTTTRTEKFVSSNFYRSTASSSSPVDNNNERGTTPAAPIDFNERNRKYRILALGGSTTYGAKLDNREDAYPNVLASQLGSNWVIKNLAARATGASYASKCIETMIREAASEPSEMGSSTREDEDFDVILLEFSLNGLDGIPLLLHRLRRRYPHAIIVSVHLWSFRMSIHNAKTGEKPRDVLNEGHVFSEADAIISKMIEDPNNEWAWSDAMVADAASVSMEALDAITKVGGHAYELKIPNTPREAIDNNWFNRIDYHHLSKTGHEIVATEIRNLIQSPDLTKLQQQLLLPSSDDDGDMKVQKYTWGKGDQCMSWFETGETAFAKFDGGRIKMFVAPDKFAFHVGQRFGTKGTITFPNLSADSQPVELSVMAWGSPSIYPKAVVKLIPSSEEGRKRLIEERGGIDDDQSMTIDPLNPLPLQRIYHVTNLIHIGWAAPGENKILVEPIETTDRALRITGIVMCGACVEMDRFYLTGDPNLPSPLVQESMKKQSEEVAKGAAPEKVLQDGAEIAEQRQIDNFSQREAAAAAAVSPAQDVDPPPLVVVQTQQQP